MVFSEGWSLLDSQTKFLVSPLVTCNTVISCTIPLYVLVFPGTWPELYEWFHVLWMLPVLKQWNHVQSTSSGRIVLSDSRNVLLRISPNGRASELSKFTSPANCRPNGEEDRRPAKFAQAEGTMDHWMWTAGKFCSLSIACAMFFVQCSIVCKYSMLWVWQLILMFVIASRTW